MIIIETKIKSWAFLSSVCPNKKLVRLQATANMTSKSYIFQIFLAELGELKVMFCATHKLKRRELELKIDFIDMLATRSEKSLRCIKTVSLI